MAKNPPQRHWRALEALFDKGALGGLTDGELLDCFLDSRDSIGHEAFRLLVERHGPMVRNVCGGLVFDQHEADDAFQATFLVLVKKAGSIEAAVIRSDRGCTAWPAASPGGRTVVPLIASGER